MLFFDKKVRGGRLRFILHLAHRPSELYLLNNSTGQVSTDRMAESAHKTSQFACDSLERWWTTEGHKQYPQARRLLLLCDGGGSNSARR
jgi:hypothetical protein